MSSTQCVHCRAPVVLLQVTCSFLVAKVMSSTQCVHCRAPSVFGI